MPQTTAAAPTADATPDPAADHPTPDNPTADDSTTATTCVNGLDPGSNPASDAVPATGGSHADAANTHDGRNSHEHPAGTAGRRATETGHVETGRAVAVHRGKAAPVVAHDADHAARRRTGHGSGEAAHPLTDRPLPGRAGCNMRWYTWLGRVECIR